MIPSEQGLSDSRPPISQTLALEEGRRSSGPLAFIFRARTRPRSKSRLNGPYTSEGRNGIGIGRLDYFFTVDGLDSCRNRSVRLVPGGKRLTGPGRRPSR